MLLSQDVVTTFVILRYSFSKSLGILRIKSAFKYETSYLVTVSSKKTGVQAYTNRGLF